MVELPNASQGHCGWDTAIHAGCFMQGNGGHGGISGGQQRGFGLQHRMRGQQTGLGRQGTGAGQQYTFFLHTRGRKQGECGMHAAGDPKRQRRRQGIGGGHATRVGLHTGGGQQGL